MHDPPAPGTVLALSQRMRREHHIRTRPSIHQSVARVRNMTSIHSYIFMHIYIFVLLLLLFSLPHTGRTQNGSGGPVTRPRDRRNEADGGLSNASGGGGGVGGLFSSMVTTPLRRTLSGYRRNDSSSGGGGSHNGTSNGHGNSNSNHGDSDHGDSGYSNGPTGTATTAGSNRGITSSGSFAAAFNSNNKSTKASPLLSMRNGRGAKDRRRSNGEAGGGRAIRRPADGRAPGRRDPVAVAKLEAAARQAAQQGEPDGVDRSWQLPTNVDYYTDRGRLGLLVRRRIL